MAIPLTKTMEAGDYLALVPELAVVDMVGIEGQHEARRWEYALALKAIKEWKAKKQFSTAALDIGGAGSNFHKMTLASELKMPCVVIDPNVNMGVEEVDSTIVNSHVVVCISVLEHVKDEWEFIAAVDKLVRPGGLLFFTMDCADGSAGDKDESHFRWMRNRIYTPHTWMELARRFTEEHNYEFLGEYDFSYNGAMVYDYTFASLALVKKER